MATNLALASIKATGGTTSRTFGTRFADVINVKDYGATGDGSTDDTAAIQAAFNAAYGTWASPNSPTAVMASVFFPFGTYIVSSSAALTITNIVNNGSGAARVTCGTHGLTTGDQVYVRGVTGTTFANGPQWVTVISSTVIDLNASTFNSAWTGSGTVGKPALRIKGANGPKIFGQGRANTVIKCTTANVAALAMNGMRYTRFEDITISGGGGALIVDLNWDGTYAQSTQGCSFSNVQISAYTGVADICVALGYNGAMTSENSFFHAQISGATYGVYIGNYNATNNTMFGGQFQSCITGIYASGGDMSCVEGVSFENTTNTAGWDIHIVNSALNAWSITNCRSESVNFLFVQPPIPVVVNGCSLMGSTGTFVSASGWMTMIGCYTAAGPAIIDGNANFVIQNCNLSGTLGAGATLSNVPSLQVTPQLVTTQTGASYSLLGPDIGSKIKFNSASAQTLTIPSGFNWSGQAGNLVILEQIGAGQLTVAAGGGTTIHSSNGLKTRARYSVLYLYSDGSDTWTLSGDSTT